jgi:hypothetical protein
LRLDQIPEATNAEEALSILRKNAADTRALVTDVRIERPHGWNRARAAASRCWPWIAPLLATAETFEQLENRPEGCKIVRKPYDPRWMSSMCGIC